MTHPFRFPLSSMTLSPIERAHAGQAIESNWISGTGSYVQLFEQALVEVLGRRYAISCNSGTSALVLTLESLGVGAGDEVIVPALTFAAPASAVRSVGALPVFADVDPHSWTIDPVQIRRQVTDRTKAIIAVDVLGHPCDYDALVAIGVPIIEDAAEAFGATYHGKLAGGFGALAVFSFHANKAITTGEGGCVLTDDPDLAHRVRLLANHGMSPQRPYWHEVVGHNFRMTNVAAAIGYAQMSRWPELVNRRRQVADLYDEALAQLPLRRRPVLPDVCVSCWLYTVASANRTVWLDGLRAAGVDARAIWTALPDLPIFRDGVRGEYPVAREICARAFWLPTYSELTAADIEEIAVVCQKIADER